MMVDIVESVIAMCRQIEVTAAVKRRRRPVRVPDRKAASSLEQLQAENQRLQERIRDLEQLCRSSSDVFPSEWRLTRREAEIFGILLAREIATPSAVMTIVYGLGDQPEPKVFQIYIFKLRKKLEPFGVVIRTDRGRGYQLIDRQRWRTQLGIVQEPRAAAR